MRCCSAARGRRDGRSAATGLVPHQLGDRPAPTFRRGVDVGLAGRQRKRPDDVVYRPGMLLSFLKSAPPRCAYVQKPIWLPIAVNMFISLLGLADLPAEKLDGSSTRPSNRIGNRMPREVGVAAVKRASWCPRGSAIRWAFGVPYTAWRPDAGRNVIDRLHTANSSVSGALRHRPAHRTSFACRPPPTARPSTSPVQSFANNCRMLGLASARSIPPEYGRPVLCGQTVPPDRGRPGSEIGRAVGSIVGQLLHQACSSCRMRRARYRKSQSAEDVGRSSRRAMTER